MRAMLLTRIGPVAPEGAGLEAADLPRPDPGPGEIRLKVAVCGVCHTELDEIEGRTAPPRLPVVPGHEVVGHVDAIGPGCGGRHREGDRVGVGWIHCSDGSPQENISPAFRATGRDANGGYADYMIVPERYAYPIPAIFSDAEAAPLLCAGAVGWRALQLTGLRNGQRLGLTGFGGSAHLVLQVVRHLYPDSPVHVFARDAAARRFALEIGAASAGATADPPPAPLDAVIDTTPAWTPVVHALASLRPGGRLVINAIRKEDDDKQALMQLSYHDHLWQEREVKSVANVTAADLDRFLPLAAEVPLRPVVETYPLAAANTALADLKHRPVRGAKVLQVAGG